MYPNIFDVLLLGVCFILPSISLAKLVFVIIKIRLSTLQMFLVGEVIWLYIFLSGAILFGLFGEILWYFKIISIVGFVLSILSIIYIMARAKNFNNRKIVIKSLSVPIYTIVFLLIIFGIILILYHHIWTEFDALAIYLPQAKGILKTGLLTFNPFDYSMSVMMSSSGLYISYAYELFLIPSLEAVRIIPIFYFICGVISLYLLSYELFRNQKTALITLAVYLSFIAVLKTFAQFSLYTDLAFVFLLTFATFLFTKWTKEKTNFWLFMCGITLTLMLFFKSMGYIIVPAMVSLLIFFAKTKWSSHLAVFVAFLPLHLETFLFIVRPWLSMNFSLTYTSDVINLLFRWSPAVIISILIMLILRKQKLPTHLTAKGFLVFLLPFAFFGLYLVYYFLEFRLLLLPHQLLNPSLEKTISLYFEVVPSSSIDLGSYYRWYNLLTEGLAGAYLIPLILGIYIAIKHLKSNNDRIMSYLPSIVVFASLFVLWSYLGCEYEPRRLLLFSPFVAIIIVQGVLFTIRFLKIPLDFGFVSFCIFIALSQDYFWKRYENVRLISLQSFGLSNFELIDYYVLATFFVFIMFLPKVLDFALNKISRYLKRNNWQQKLFQTTTLLFIAGLFSQALIVSGMTSYLLSTQEFNGEFNDYQSIEHYYNMQKWGTIWLLGDFPDVISYFNNLPDSYGVLGFYIHYLKIYANRSIVDLTWSYGYERFGEIFTLNQTKTLEGLYQNDIRYILLPKANHPIYSVYQTYLKSKSILPFLNDTDPSIFELEGRDYVLTPTHQFTCYELYSIKQVVYPFTIHPLVFGNTDYVMISPSTSLNAIRNVTVDAWVYMDKLPSKSGENFEISGKQWNTLRFFVAKENDKLTVTQSYDGVNFSDQANTILLPERWYHFAYTFDGKLLKIYIDSVQVANIVRDGVLGTNISPLLLHSFQNESVNRVPGMMAAYRIYNRALSADEIVWNYGNTMNPINSNLVLWFKFDENNGETLHDASGNDNNGIINGAIWFKHDNH